ncbi:hypothetical protein H4R34_005461 [Dimargaris verticillata]|uniref:RGS domain-containing protein n=1 Tax=Dimargaris verticillata TaxID=2761393 RepID=A0A9W8EAQ2_9FUNG|nr:hypothetical protein H4R34_005461 [Dimargaris verticillata]
MLSDHERTIKYAVMGTLTAIGALYVFVTSTLFYLRGQKIRDIQQRSMTLTMIQCFVIFTQVVISGLGGMLNEDAFPCFVLFWGVGFGCLLLTLIFSARSFRYAFQVALNRLRSHRCLNTVDTSAELGPESRMAAASTKSLRRAIKDLLSLFHPRGIYHTSCSDIQLWFIDNRRILASEASLTALMMSTCTAATIYNLCVTATTPYFALSPAETNCHFGWPYYPMMVWIGLHLVAVYPFIVYSLWHASDAYGIRTDLIVCCVTGGVGQFMFIIWQLFFRFARDYVSSLLWFFVTMLIIHTSSVTVPVIKMLRLNHTLAREFSLSRAKLSSPSSHYSQWQVYLHALEQPATLHQLKQVAAQCLCSQAVVFLEEYQELKKILVSIFTPVLDVLELATFRSSHTIAIDSQMHNPMSMSYASDLPRVSFKTNALSLYMDEPEPEFKEVTHDKPDLLTPIGEPIGNTWGPSQALAKSLGEGDRYNIRDNATIVCSFNLFAQQFLMPHSDLISQVTLQCAAGITKRVAHGDYSFDMFDAAHKEILEFVFRNVYSKLVAQQ